MDPGKGDAGLRGCEIAKMIELNFYIVGASPDPDSIKGNCKVPYEASENTIFFGPCKKRLRELLHKRFLSACDDFTPDEEIYIAGANKVNAKKIRKILWVGKIACKNAI